MIVYMLGDLVVWIGGASQSPPMYLAFDNMRDGPEAASASIGTVWNGSTFVAPAANSEPANVATLRERGLEALAVNTQAITDANAWLTTGPGAGSANLTAAQSSAVIRSMMRAHVTACQQRNGVIRLLLGALDGTD